MSYAIQRITDGYYIAPIRDIETPEPHQAYLFATRRAAQQYIDREMLADDHLVAILPDSRPLLSVPGEFKC